MRLIHVNFFAISSRMMKVALPSVKISKFSSVEFPQNPLEISFSGACFVKILIPQKEANIMSPFDTAQLNANLEIPSYDSVLSRLMYSVYHSRGIFADDIVYNLLNLVKSPVLSPLALITSQLLAIKNCEWQEFRIFKAQIINIGNSVHLCVTYCN